MKKISKLYFLAIAALGLTSCLEDPNIEDQKYGMIDLNANKIIELPVPSKALALPLENKSVTVDFFAVHLAAEQVAQEDINVVLSFAKSQEKITAYNTENGTKVVLFPADKYTLPEGTTVTIPKGSRDGYVKLTTNAATLDPAAVYALGFDIVSVDKPGYIVSGNFNSNLMRVSVKNKYDGVYRVTNLVFNNVTAPAHSAISPRTRQLITTSATTAYAWDPALNGGYAGINFSNNGAGSLYGNFSPVFTFDATDKVVSVSNFHPVPNPQGRNAALDPTGVNKFTVVSGTEKKLEVSYIMTVNGVNTLYLKELWEYTGSRP